MTRSKNEFISLGNQTKRKRTKRTRICEIEVYGFHGFSEALLRFERSEATDIRELCLETDVNGRDKRELLSCGNKIFSNCWFRSSISLWVNCSRGSNVIIGPRTGCMVLASD